MFARSTTEWLNPNGAFKYLYKMNKIRVPYITDLMDIKGKRILDVGAGGGILSLELLKLGAHVTSIDLETSNLDVMKEIRDKTKSNNWEIRNENLFDLRDQYDLVVASEVIEHVQNKHPFLTKCCELTSKEGKVVISTMNKTILSHFITITMAEDILEKIDKGTHDSRLYLCPEDINVKGFHLDNIRPFILNPLTDELQYISWPMIHWIGILSRIQQ